LLSSYATTHLSNRKEDWGSQRLVSVVVSWQPTTVATCTPVYLELVTNKIQNNSLNDKTTCQKTCDSSIVYALLTHSLNNNIIDKEGRLQKGMFNDDGAPKDSTYLIPAMVRN
jgi:hypothetical protein